MKKILVLANYFYPDKVAFVPLITELCESLQEQYEVVVIAGQEEDYIQKERVKIKNYKKIKILRVKTTMVDKKNKISRIKYILSYFCNSIYAIWKEKDIDIIYAVSQPPILGGLLGLVAKIIKKRKLIYNIQDFNPEAIEVIGYSKNKIMLSVARFLDNLSCCFSNVVIVVGRDMKEKFNERYNFRKKPKIEVINNWANEKELYPLENTHVKVKNFREKNGLNNKIVVAYSGNIGLFYDLEKIVEVFSKFKKNTEILFLFIGEGAIKEKLENFCRQNDIENIMFLPYQKKEELIYSLNSVDIHLVTNAKGIKGISVPSKIYAVMCVGKPTLGVLEKNSEARILIEESNSGYCCEPGEYKELEKILEKILDDKELLVEKGLRARRFVEKFYGKENSIKKYIDIFDSFNKR